MPDVLAAFARVARTSTGWSAQCPAHEDAKNSLSIHQGDDGRWLLKCFAGCELDAILAAAHLTMAALFPGNGRSRGPVATYDYRDEQGELLYQVCRFAPKDFRQRAADGSWSIKGLRRVLYRLPELRGKKTVLIVEGEKDADRLWALGLPATTNAGGAGKWRAEYPAMLQAAGVEHVVVLPDHDAPGVTHGRTVARACADAGLAVKLIPLPDLPEKGDVSDYLACHTKDAFLALVRGAPLYRGDHLVAAEPALTFTALTEFLDEPDQAVEWLVTDRIPAGAVVLFVGAPKAGKSTAVRELALAVARGDPWLAWPTSPGAVWLLTFEDRRVDVRAHFRRLGATGVEPLRVFVGQAPADLLPRLQTLATAERPALIIIDTLARASRVSDINDYAAVSAALTPWLQLARDSGATLVLVHHASAHHAREGLDAVLGSTAFVGSVDNVVILRRVDGRRVLSTVQRIGPDLEPTIVTLSEGGRLTCGGTKRLVDERDLRDRLVAALATAAEPMRETWLHDQIDGRKADKVRALRVLLSQHRVVRTGAGGRGDPYLYRCATDDEKNTGSQTSGLGTRNANGTRREPESEAVHPIDTDLFAAESILVPELSVPSVRSRSLERSRELYTERPETLVPAGAEIAPSDTSKTAGTPDKHCPDSGSQISAPNDTPAPQGPNSTRPNGDLGTSIAPDKTASDSGSQISEIDDGEGF